MSDDAWLTDYVLGEQTDVERAAAETRLAADPDLRRRVDELREVSARLHALPAAGWAGLEPPTELIPAPTQRRPPRWHGRVSVRVSAAWAATACALGVMAGALVFSGSTAPAPPTGRAVVLSALPGSPSAAHGEAVLTGDGELRLTVAGLPRTPGGVYYEAWLMTDARRLVALATFRVMDGGRATVQIVLPAAIDAYRYVDVSRQDVRAGPAHSADSVLRGPTAPA